MKKIAVIGSGPAGLMSIYSLIKNGYKDITLYESDNQIGKRIKVSGNGRCNFFHIPLEYDKYSSALIAKDYMDEFLLNSESIFMDLGLKYIIDEEGRVYPRSDSSKMVVRIFERFLNKNNIKIQLNTRIEKLEKDNGKIKIYYQNVCELYDFVVLSIGGFSYKYNKEEKIKFLKDSNIHISKITPSLVPIKTSKYKNKLLEGKRFKVNLSLFEKDKKIYEEYGEVLFKKDGISGIVTFNVSSILARKHLNSYKGYKIEIDFAPDLNMEKLKAEIFNPLFSLKENLENLFIEELKDELLMHKEIDIIKNIKHYSLEVIDLYPFESSQVTSGGIDVYSLKDMLLKNYDNVYPCGEILDIDGLCGGYNIAFAFASGYNVKNVIKK